MRKVVKILAVSFAAILFIAASVTAFSYFTIYTVVSDKFNAKNSANPKATSYFIYAAVLSTWAEYRRELGASYDSLTLRPVLHLRDYLFERGESLTAEDNAEDAFWWVQNYAEFYGFLKDEPNNKYTIENLDFRKKEEIVNRLYTYVIKLGAHDIRGITQTKYNNKLSIASNIVAAYLRSAIELYQGKTVQERNEMYYRDVVLSNKIAAAYDAYKSVLEGAKNLKDMKFDKAYYEYYLYDMLEYLMISKIIDKSSPATDLCSYRFTGDYLAVFRSMLVWSEDKNIKKSAAEQDHVNLFLNAALSKNRI